MQYGCDNTQEVEIPLSPMKQNGHVATLDGPPTAVVVEGGGDAVFLAVSPSAIILRSGSAFGETFFDVTGTEKGVSITERHSLMVSDSPLSTLGLANPDGVTVRPKPEA